MIFRPVSRKDIASFYKDVPFSINGIAAERDGELVGIGGLYYEKGRCFVFSAFCDSLTKREIVKGASAIMKLAEKVRGPLYATAEGGEKAERTLAHFGFAPLSGPYWVRYG